MSGHGKTTLIASLVRSLRNNSRWTRIIIFDPKAGRDLPADVRTAVEIVDFEKDAEGAIEVLRQLENEARMRGELQVQHGITGEFHNVWLEGVLGWRAHPFTVIIFDECSRLLDESRSKKDLTSEERLQNAFQTVVTTGLERWRSVHLSVVLVTQSARASKLKTIVEASDNFSIKLLGPQNQAMAQALGHTELHTEKLLREKGTFLLERGPSSQIVKVSQLPSLKPMRPN